MRVFNKALVALDDVVHGQGTQAGNAEILAGERADQIAVDNGALEIVGGIMAIAPRSDRREITQEAAGKGVTGTSGIDHLLKRVGRGAEIGAIGAKEQRAIAALLDDHIFQAEREEIAHAFEDTGVPGK